MRVTQSKYQNNSYPTKMDLKARQKDKKKKKKKKKTTQNYRDAK